MPRIPGRGAQDQPADISGDASINPKRLARIYADDPKLAAIGSLFDDKLLCIDPLQNTVSPVILWTLARINRPHRTAARIDGVISRGMRTSLNWQAGDSERIAIGRPRERAVRPNSILEIACNDP